ncbi:MAG: multidrug efflux pump subunit AcrB, partial [Lysobacterales bacterium]
MMEKLISFFAKRHLLTNMIMLVVFIGGIFAWNQTKKEEWPDITFDNVRISARYSGAPASDVEYFVTKPIEEEVRGLDGVYRVTSTSSVGQSNVNVELEQNYPNVNEAITEIRNAVLDVQLPSEVIDDPNVRVFRSSKKAILDIALYDTGTHLLDIDSRRNLQKYAYAFEQQLLNLSEVNSVNKNGYLQEEIQIKAIPKTLVKFELPFNTVMREIKDNNIRKPAGTIQTAKEPKVTLLSELNTVDKLNNLVIQGGFEGQVIRLNEAAQVIEGYEKNKQITKVNGHEAILFSVVKNSSSGILESLDAVSKAAEQFKRNNLEGSSINLALLDDESIDLRNRLNIISTNGAIGFFLILIMLYFFLNKRAAFWVAMGIPFTFCFTMLCASFLGQTINGMTLAAVIIVMGIVVDDAIVVAENISRLEREGMAPDKAAVKGTSFVILPIIASVLTTCVAFIPLYFFQGHFGNFVKYIPLIVFLMLGASLLESLLILPGHMHFKLPFMRRSNIRDAQDVTQKYHWFDLWEEMYGNLLIKMLAWKKIVLVGFAGVLILTAVVATTTMKFVLFPNEETRDVVLSGTALRGSDRYQTAELTAQIENIIMPYIGEEVVGFRTQIARSRRGGAVQENKFRMIIEIVPKEKRKKSADQLIKEFEKPILALE